MNLSPQLAFKPDITLVSDPDPALITPNTRLDVSQFSPGILAAIKILCDGGATEAKLTDEVVKVDTFTGLSKFLYYLTQFTRSGLICYGVPQGNETVATLVPLVKVPEFRLQTVTPETPCKLSRFAFSYNRDDRLVLESPVSRFRMEFPSWKGGAIVAELARSRSSQNLADTIPGLELETAQLIVSLLVSAEILETPEMPEPDALKTWEFHDLLFHTRSRQGRHDNTYGKTYRFYEKTDAPPFVKPQMSSERIDLYQPNLEQLKESDLPFAKVIEMRHSTREFDFDRPISARELGELLYRCAHNDRVFSNGRMECGKRPYPSGGACYELEIYPVVKACDGISPGVYHYAPEAHQLEKIDTSDKEFTQLAGEVERITVGDCQPQIFLSIAARFSRVSWGYQSMAYALILKHVGVLYQTLYLTATAMDLGCLALGGGNADLFSRTIGTNYYLESSVGEFAIGRKLPLS